MLDKQVRRMLRDPKAQALVDNFAGQWLQLRNLKSVNPDRGTYPNFDEPLRQAMIRETELFFGAVMRGDLSLLDFLDADFTYVNERLARHYGIPGSQGRAISPREAQGPATRWAGDAGEHLDGDLESNPDLARQAGQVGAGATAGDASASAASQRPDSSRRPESTHRGNAFACGWSSIAPR